MTAWTELENRSLSEIRARHHALKLSIAAKAKVDTGVKCPSASQRSPEPISKPKAKPREILVYPVIPEQNEYKNPPIPVDNLFFTARKIGAIQRMVCAFGNVTMIDLLSDRRFRPAVRARQIGMYLARMTTRRSIVYIGQKFGNRDHTTVLHAIRKVEELMAADPVFAAGIANLLAQIERGLTHEHQAP
jgi:hypothetical protein